MPQTYLVASSAKCSTVLLMIADREPCQRYRKMRTIITASRHAIGTDAGETCDKSPSDPGFEDPRGGLKIPQFKRSKVMRFKRSIYKFW